MNNPGLFQARWNLRRLALCNLVPLALLAFWLWPTGQMLCGIFDERLPIHSIRRWRLPPYGCAFG